MKEDYREIFNAKRDLRILLLQLKEKATNFFSDITEMDYSDAEDYIDVYYSVVDDYYKIYVGAELTYESLDELGQKLTGIINDYNEDSYFEPAEPGILVSALPTDSITASTVMSSIKLDDPDMSLYKFGETVLDIVTYKTGLNLRLDDVTIDENEDRTQIEVSLIDVDTEEFYSSTLYIHPDENVDEEYLMDAAEGFALSFSKDLTSNDYSNQTVLGYADADEYQYLSYDPGEGIDEDTDESVKSYFDIKLKSSDDGDIEVYEDVSDITLEFSYDSLIPENDKYYSDIIKEDVLDLVADYLYKNRKFGRLHVSGIATMKYHFSDVDTVDPDSNFYLTLEDSYLDVNVDRV